MGTGLSHLALITLSDKYCNSLHFTDEDSEAHIGAKVTLSVPGETWLFISRAQSSGLLHPVASCQACYPWPNFNFLNIVSTRFLLIPQTTCLKTNWFSSQPLRLTSHSLTLQIVVTGLALDNLSSISLLYLIPMATTITCSLTLWTSTITFFVSLLLVFSHSTVFWTWLRCYSNILSSQNFRVYRILKSKGQTWSIGSLLPRTLHWECYWHSISALQKECHDYFPCLPRTQGAVPISAMF